jgi:hypothetical protein
MRLTWTVSDGSSAAPIGSRTWLENLRDDAPLRSAAAQSNASPEPVRQFLREIGRRGGLERCRRLARRYPRLWARFHRRYGSNPNEVKAPLIRANEMERRYLRTFASRGGQARARRYPKETLRAWAAKGGYAKADKLKQARPSTQPVAGKQE